MDDVDRRTAEAVEALKSRRAVFAYLHGSRAAGTAGPDSDIDIAAYFDELPRLNRAHREFAEAALRRGR